MGSRSELDASDPIQVLWSAGTRRGSMLPDQVGELQRLLPEYELLEELQHGGQGVVFRALQKSTKRIVALKVLLDARLADERQRRRFEREAELTARLEHPHIVGLYASGVAGGHPYCVFQYIEGDTIDDYVLRKDASVREILALCVTTCRAVGYAHQSGIIHRDLHLGNLLVDEQGRPYVLDFGLAQDLDAMRDERVTAPGQVLGALPFLSPEHLGAEDGRIDTRSDVYSLGVVLYYLLTERFPYPVQGSYGSVRQAIVEREPVPVRQAMRAGDPERRARPADVTRDLEAIIARALAKRKADRYPSATELAEDLERCLAGDIVLARAAQRGYLARKVIRRYRIPLAITAAFAAVLVGAVVFSFRALQNARAASRLAFEQYDFALSRVEESLRTLPGGLRYRSELLEHLAATLPDLARRAATDSDLADLRWKLAEREGDVALAQGRLVIAAQRYESCLADALAHWQPRACDAEQAMRTLRAFWKSGAVAASPETVYERGAEFAAGLPERLLVDEPVRRQAAEFYLQSAEELRARRASGQAEEYAGRALALRPRDPRAPERWLGVAARGLSIRGQARVLLGRVDDGLRDLEIALERAEADLAQEPFNVLLRQEAADICAQLGFYRVHSGAQQAGVDLLRAALQHREQLHAADPVVWEWAKDLCAARWNLGQVYCTAGERDLARAEAEAILSTLAPFGQELAGSPDYSTQVAFGHSLLGQAELESGCHELALSAFHRAADEHRRAVRLDPGNAKYLGNLTVALQNVAIALGSSADWESVYDVAGESCRLCDLILTQHPHAPVQLLNAALARISLAAAGIKLSRAAEADRLLNEAEELIREIEAQGEKNVLSQRCADARAGLEHNRRLVYKLMTELGGSGQSAGQSVSPTGGTWTGSSATSANGSDVPSNRSE